MKSFDRIGLGLGMVVGLWAASCGSGGALSDSPAAGGSAGVPATGGSAGSGGGVPVFEEQRSALPRNTTPDISSTDYARFIANTNDFGLDLFHQLVPAETNFFYSPVSTALALGMTYAGAQGNTATQMAAAFHSDLPTAIFHAGMNQLLLDLGTRNVAPYTTQYGTKSLTLLPANAAWAQTGYGLASDYLDTLATDYGAGINLLDFMRDPDGSKDTINQWVAQQTRDRIPELIPDGAIDASTRLVLTNAIYFYGSWASQFDQASTRDGTFHTLGGSDVTVPMLHDGRYVPYVEGDGYQMIELGYEGGQLAMDVLLPAAGRLTEIRDGLTAAWIEQAHAAMTTSDDVVLQLPKFRFTWGTKPLSAPLKALGMTDAFDGSLADFSGMTGDRDLYISDVVHQAFVALDENGTEAAAATAVMMSGSGMPVSTKEFTVDRPFLIFIRDASGALLFAGQVGDPSV